MKTLTCYIIGAIIKINTVNYSIINVKLLKILKQK